MIVLDTTVLVYAVGADHPLREPCRSLLEAIAAGNAAATTTTEVVQEFAHVYARRRPRREAARIAGRYVSLLAPLVEVSGRDVERGLELFARSERLGAFDAVLAATALDREAEALVSADQAFAAVPGLGHVVPGSPAFDRLLQP